MNSLYKRYIYVTLIILVLSSLVFIRNARESLSIIDEINAYAAEHGEVGQLMTDNSQYAFYFDGDKIVPFFDNYLSTNLYLFNMANWLLMLTLTLAFLYLPEKTSATADFYGALPIKQRHRFTVRLICILFLLIVPTLINIWSIYAYNQRIDRCNATYEILNVGENLGRIENTFSFIAEQFTLKLVVTAVFFLLCEITSKVYMPAVIYVIGSFAISGSREGLHDYLYNVFGLDIPRLSLYSLLNRLELSKGTGAECLFCLSVSLILILLSLYLSGKGDMSRKNCLFRFKAIEQLVIIFTVIGSMLCCYEIICITDLNYLIPSIPATLIMLFTGAAAYIVSRCLILRLGR